VDPRLLAAGWKAAASCEQPQARQLVASAVPELPTTAGPADYALCDGGRIRGVVEAKKVTLGPQGVLPQAERYSRAILQEPRYQGEYGVPFLYSTNGEVIWFHDVRDPLNRSRQIGGFHSPAALSEALARDFDAQLARLETIPPNGVLRSYQHEASAAIESAIRDRKRKLLVTMATGTGKTLTLVNETYRLMKSGVAQRVLFLVDRRALAAQAVQAFSAFEAEPGMKFDKVYELYNQRFHKEDLEESEFEPKVLPTKYLTQPKLGQAFVYVSTVQRMAINLFGKGVLPGFDGESEEDAERLNIPIHAFDLVIADECHRGYSTKEMSVWRNTLDHFDAITIGLTATPALHTTSYFQNIVYRYEYTRAVAEGYLVDYDVVKVSSGVRMHGVFLEQGDEVQEVDPATGTKQLDLIEDERVFDTTKIEHEITAPDSNRKILEEVRRYALEHELEYKRFPKTLIFADNDMPHTSHSDQLVDLGRDVFGQGDAFVQKITGRVDRPLQKIREFRNRPNPKVVVSVDLLTTGVDVQDIEFIVFLRPVKSRILFEQMLGRGTRKSDRYPDKSHFVVFDCFDGTLLAFFKNATGMTVEPPESDGKTTPEIIDEIWNNHDRDYNVRRLIRRLRRVEKEMAGEAREAFAKYVPDGDIGQFTDQLTNLLHTSFKGVMTILRDKGFQDLLRSYPRATRTFLVAPGIVDTVTSERLIKGADGKDYKPEDYLAAFSRYVRANKDHIVALTILLSRPQGWSTEALRQLRKALSETPDRFTEQSLRLAFEQTAHKALVDIISMVKRGAEDASPLYTASERVDHALGVVAATLTPTPEQARWLDHIRQHLIANLSIDPGDFDEMPVLANRGGWGRANRVFNGKLAGLLKELNREVAAA
jgi:type I restriction enzyme R subunit